MVSKIIFSLGSGVLLGIYLGQNYNLPNVKKWCEQTYTLLQGIEENYRKGDR